MSDVIWHPSEQLVRECSLSRYLRWLETEHGLAFDDYLSLWRWSTDELEAFWRSVWDFCGVVASRTSDRVLESTTMPGARWFPGARLNYAENLLHRLRDDSTALIALSEDEPAQAVTGREVRRQAGAFAATLRSVGVGRGDRVVAYLPNRPEAVVGLAACTSIGAIWSVCPAEFGLSAVVSRFRQLRPKVLIAGDGYRFGSRAYSRRDEVAQLVSGLGTVEHVIWVPVLDPEEGPLSGLVATAWADATSGDAELSFEQLPFDHPLWVLFSSGTTGLPKGIVHGHGGITLELLKAATLHYDLHPRDHFQLVTSTGWVLWNMLVSTMLVGAVPVLFDGNPAYPDLDTIWRIASDQRVNLLGMGAAYIHASMKAGLRPAHDHDLSALRQLFSTGSPLSADGYRWVSREVGAEVWLASSSGGTDVCGAFVGGVPLLPVRIERLQAPYLGVAVEAWNEHGEAVLNETGELVVTKPMPSMPLHLWDDPDGEKLYSSYFSTYSGVWRHGDFIEFDADGTSIIRGRSDSTLNRRGIRIGTAEIYGVVERLAEVIESLVVGVEFGDNDYYMPLFAVLAPGTDEDRAKENIAATIRQELSPRHVPDEIVVVPAIPHTRTGKKLEVPVKRMIQGAELVEVADPNSVDDQAALSFFAEFAKEHRRRAKVKT